MATTKRTNPDRKWNINDVEFVYNNYGQMTARQIAEERGLAPFQVNQIITNLRQRKIMGKKRGSTYGQICDQFAKRVKK